MPERDRGTSPPSEEARTAERIHRAIAQDPGLTPRELARLLGLGRGTVEYHTHRLLREGRIRETRVGRARRCFPLQMTPIQILRVGVLRQGRSGELARAVLSSPGIIQRELTASVSMTRKVFRSCIRLLVAAGLLREERASQRRHYFATPPLEELARLPEPPGLRPPRGPTGR